MHRINPGERTFLGCLPHLCKALLKRFCSKRWGAWGCLSYLSIIVAKGIPPEGFLPATLVLGLGSDNGWCPRVGIHSTVFLIDRSPVTWCARGRWPMETRKSLLLQWGLGWNLKVDPFSLGASTFYGMTDHSNQSPHSSSLELVVEVESIQPA